MRAVDSVPLTKRLDVVREANRLPGCRTGLPEGGAPGIGTQRQETLRPTACLAGSKCVPTCKNSLTWSLVYTAPRCAMATSPFGRQHSARFGRASLVEDHRRRTRLHSDSTAGDRQGASSFISPPSSSERSQTDRQKNAGPSKLESGRPEDVSETDTTTSPRPPSTPDSHYPRTPPAAPTASSRPAPAPRTNKTTCCCRKLFRCSLRLVSGTFRFVYFVTILRTFAKTSMARPKSATSAPNNFGHAELRVPMAPSLVVAVAST